MNRGQADRRKVVYIAGPITGVRNYRENFKRAAEKLEEMGCIPLNPAMLPAGLTNEQYMQIDLAMLNAADAVYFLPGWQYSHGARLERDYCAYIGKEVL